MIGNEIRSRLRWPKVLIVQTAGPAYPKLTAPDPNETVSVDVGLKPPWTKMYPELLREEEVRAVDDPLVHLRGTM